MKIPVWLKVFVFMLSSVLFVGKGYGQTAQPDYSSYIIAKQYQKDKNYVLCYKHLIIFRCANQQRLELPVNRDALTQLDNLISQVEEYLRQTSACMAIKGARGFSDKQMDSTFRSNAGKIELKQFSIN